MATINRTGFGQVEPNLLSYQKTAQMYAQLPVTEDLSLVENGQFLKYDTFAGECNLTGRGEWHMVFNEIKLYDDYRETYKDYAMQRVNFTNEIITPRLVKINIGDIYTTNCVGEGNTSGTAEYAGIDINAGDVLTVNATNGYLKVGSDTDDFLLEVAEVYTMADQQIGLRLRRVK